MPVFAFSTTQGLHNDVFSMNLPGSHDRIILVLSRRLQKLRDKKALFGASCDPAIEIEIEDIESQLATLQSSPFIPLLTLQGGDLMTVPAEVIASASVALFTLGEIAVGLLKAKLVARKVSGKPGVEINLKQGREANRAAVQSLVTELIESHGAATVKGVMDTLSRRQQLHFEWEQAKLDLEESYNRQRITLTAYRLEKADLQTKIEENIVAIERDLLRLGLSLEGDENAAR